MIQWLPKQLRHWKPKDKSPLPNPPECFLEMEAARFWACPLDHWEQLSVIRKAKMQAHFLHVRMREGYSMEHATGDKSKKSDLASLDDLMSVVKNNPCIEVIGRPAKGQ